MLVGESQLESITFFDSEKFPTIEPEQLPTAFNNRLAQYPELLPLLQGAANFDSSIVLHCLTVDAMVQRLLKDVFLRYPLPPDIQLKILQSAGWVLMHDFGKVMVHHNPTEARKIYYPTEPINRSITEMGLHWSHSVISAALFYNWATLHPVSSSIPINVWTKHIAAHHYNLRRFLKNFEQYSQLQTGFHAIIQYFFKLSDVVAATGFPRENNGVHSPTKIKEILHTQWLTDSLLKQHFPFADSTELEELKHYLVTALFDTYNSIRHTLPDTAWLGKHRVILSNDLDLDKSLELFYHLQRHTYDHNQREWWELLERMVGDGVFERLQKK